MDRTPDREGYLGFKEAIEKGNNALFNRATAVWWAEQPPKSELAHYMNLHLTEQFIEKHFRPADYKQVEAKATNRITEIENPALREKISKRVERLIEAWFNAKFKASVNYLEYTHGDMGWQTKTRQQEYPDETEGQSWFHVKRDTDTRHLDHLDHLKAKFERAVDKHISRSLGAYAKLRAADALNLARQFATSRQARSANLGKDHDRER